jgi:hypothetical protein
MAACLPPAATCFHDKQTAFVDRTCEFFKEITGSSVPERYAKQRILQLFEDLQDAAAVDTPAAVPSNDGSASTPATSGPQEPIDKPMESDSGENEDLALTTLQDLLLPPSGLFSSGMYSLTYSKRAFDGWVKQPSPCCAAAAVAGAWNCVRKIHRSDNAALDHILVLDVYKDHLLKIIGEKTASIERLLGKSVDAVVRSVQNHFSAEGTCLGSLKRKKDVLEVLHKVCREEVANRKRQTACQLNFGTSAPARAPSPLAINLPTPLAINVTKPPSKMSAAELWCGVPQEEPPPMPPKLCLTLRRTDGSMTSDLEKTPKEVEYEPSMPPLLPLLVTPPVGGPTSRAIRLGAAEEDGTTPAVASEPLKVDTSVTSSAAADLDSEEEDAFDRILGMFEVDETNALASSMEESYLVEVRSSPRAFSPKKKGRGIVIDGWWKWKEDFVEVFGKMGGLEKLNRANPNTAEIGNWGPVSAMVRLSELHLGAGSERFILPFFRSSFRVFLPYMPSFLALSISTMQGGSPAFHRQAVEGMACPVQSSLGPGLAQYPHFHQRLSLPSFILFLLGQ